MQSEKEQKKTKQPYNKPSLVKLDLKVDEVLATNCKFTGGRSWPGLPDCGLGANCSQSGS